MQNRIEGPSDVHHRNVPFIGFFNNLRWGLGRYQQHPIYDSREGSFYLIVIPDIRHGQYTLQVAS
jgi:hypothetical protein